MAYSQLPNNVNIVARPSRAVMQLLARSSSDTLVIAASHLYASLRVEMANLLITSSVIITEHPDAKVTAPLLNSDLLVPLTRVPLLNNPPLCVSQRVGTIIWLQMKYATMVALLDADPTASWTGASHAVLPKSELTSTPSVPLPVETQRKPAPNSATTGIKLAVFKIANPITDSLVQLTQLLLLTSRSPSANQSVETANWPRMKCVTMGTESDAS